MFQVFSTRMSSRLGTIGVGSDNGVTRDWKGHVLRGDSTTPYDGGDVTIEGVGLNRTRQGFLGVVR